VGHLNPWYGLPVLFQAFALLADRQPADRLLIVGAGPERPYLDQLALDLGIAAQVAWEPEGTFDVSPDCLARMDIVVAPYLPPADDRDGLGRLFEYMAASRPIIATCLEPIRAVLQHGRSAWLVQPDDPVGIAAAIGILRRSPMLRASMAHHGYIAFRDRHTWKHVLQTILDYSRSDTEGAPGPGNRHLGSGKPLWVGTAP
jgi:glycosyltransferase involved in cell wall biosynthesis